MLNLIEVFTGDKSFPTSLRSRRVVLAYWLGTYMCMWCLHAGTLLKRLSLSLSLSPFNVDEFSLLLLHCKTFWKSWNLGNWKPRFFSLELCRWLLVYDLRRICEIYASLTRFYKLKTHKFLFFLFFLLLLISIVNLELGAYCVFFIFPSA